MKTRASRIADAAAHATLILTLVLIVLRFTGVIAWSWWWVLFPALLPFGVTLLMVIVAIILIRVYGK